MYALCTRMLAWAARNERHLGALLFVFGFITDLLTFTLLSVDFVNGLFLGYLAVAALSTLGTHVFVIDEGSVRPWWHRTLAVVCPLGLQYAIGSLLSGFLIFYTKSAVVAISWPFLLLLGLIFIGNEYFRSYKNHLVFQTVLFFFTLYAYAVFALPLYVNALGPWVFAGSTAISLVLFTLFLIVLGYLNRSRLMAYVLPITGWSLAVVAVVVTAYVTSVIPPLPLTLPEAGIYQQVERTSEGYVLTGEPTPPWWQFWTPVVVHHVPGTSLYAFSAIFAPVHFSVGVIHVWERYDTVQKRWVIENKVPFVIAGGRQGGYRGYSLVSNPTPGRWRITIETSEGRAIGRRQFVVENAPSVELVHNIIK